MIIGVVIGLYIGYTPQLFIVMATACLLLGFLLDGRGEC